MTLDIDVAAAFTAEGADRFRVAADLSVADGETLVVLGPSGSGKSLLLETVAGFHDHEGRVALSGRDLTDEPPEERGLGFVFQDYALFPHMSVRENVAFGGRYHDTRDSDELLAEFGVADLADRYPPTLSGGESQRVALARALAVRPDAFLLDEPLSALDVPTRQTLREVLADVLADETAMYVTHNRTTARAIADRVAVIRDGRIVQIGSSEEIFERPESPFVARFTGANCLELEAGELAVPGGSLSFDGDGEGEGDATHLAVRPEHVELDPPNPDFSAPVERVVREDGRDRVALDVAGQRLDAYADTAGPLVSERSGSEQSGSGSSGSDTSGRERADGGASGTGEAVGVALPRDRVTVLSDR
ncbi:ABC transporter ATP-binding protein [Halorussus gelatinilyticus]|uniref:Molybdate/tungstate import ATP-binding protein WtpC n=1 Tax=Halorussus gelatinilyticus TaxID=2937524 RepID=A0A8U0IN65_9EURY|nr:ABC transporter ATP-binding protein [Halorussus gelatinilyticus]UPW01459.1 ABC transporter ATP-binding protein [Halorussus gelatinilyticus]